MMWSVGGPEGYAALPDRRDRAYGAGDDVTYRDPGHPNLVFRLTRNDPQPNWSAFGWQEPVRGAWGA